MSHLAQLLEEVSAAADLYRRDAPSWAALLDQAAAALVWLVLRRGG